MLLYIYILYIYIVYYFYELKERGLKLINNHIMEIFTILINHQFKTPKGKLFYGSIASMCAYMAYIYATY